MLKSQALFLNYYFEQIQNKFSTNIAIFASDLRLKTSNKVIQTRVDQNTTKCSLFEPTMNAHSEILHLLPKSVSKLVDSKIICLLFV